MKKRRTKSVAAQGIILLILLLVTASGCGKKVAPTPTVSTAAPQFEAAQATAAAGKISGAPVAQPAPPASQNIGNIVTAESAAQQMSLELRKYVAYTRTIPKNFEDFVAHHQMKFPAAPAGKKYAIEGAQVVVR